jgi:broad specificity phosphatase PhoE
LCSPLRRARHTAEVIAAACGLPVCSDDRFRERMNWGDSPSPQSLEEFMADWHRATAQRRWVPPSGSSSDATGARMCAALEELVVSAGVDAALCVTHGGATVDLLRRLIGDDELDAIAPGCLHVGIPSCAFTRLTYTSRWQVHEVGAARL